MPEPAAPPSSLFGEDLAAGAHLRLLVIHGANLSQLQARDPRLYGRQSLAELLDDLRRVHANLDAFQSEYEGALVERIHQARTDGTDVLLINPGALTHYSYALRDALELLALPKAEVHLSHTFGRDAFRRRSTVAPVVDVTVTGLGARGYKLAVRLLLRLALQRAGRPGQANHRSSSDRDLPAQPL